METRPKERKQAAPQGPKEPDAVGTSSKPSVSVCDDLHVLIANRAHELYVERGCRDGHALDDWLEAERQVLSQVPPA